MAKGGKGDFASREKYLCFSAFAGATYSSAALAVMQTMPRVFKVLMTRLGLPQMNPVNEQIRERMSAAFNAGYDYTYLFLGIRKVVQAAGRVIRTQGDQGIIYLMDDRFSQHKVFRLLPKWWKIERFHNKKKEAR